MSISEFLGQELFSISDYALTIKNIVFILVLLAGTKFLLFILGKFIIKGSPEERARRISLFQLVKYVFWVIAISIGLESLGVKISIIIAGSAALLVGIGLGLQQIFNDLVSGLFLLYEGSIKTRDIIEVDNMVGRVVKINLRTSVILTRDGVNVIVPNHKFITENVINWSHYDSNKRFEITVGVAYNSDVNKVIEILLACAGKHPKVLKGKEGFEPTVRFNNFGDSALEFQLLFWSENIFRIETTRSDLRKMIIEEFRKNDISIPFPQQDVYIKSVPS
ncbi:MAG: mechanosensitive ion channel protein MscS [Bacteroidetes bacterium]|nr:MAG: mechanosensitive ion channel protein MscS [Bacteroidota bacterium]REK03526.1 MAG: mechanosensitive ion channel protein MscS [Bacteroidota bacterium]REK34829.1 MAG: mechanosensitive ion channel protein MscS [Bacteroidota bacterium]REK51200.1 MAG: mechanosensitive ion channel protein MscS [Bacteroidota bacterium]